jgi:hypothetical protein
MIPSGQQRNDRPRAFRLNFKQPRGESHRWMSIKVFKPHQVGVQIPRGVHSQVPEKDIVCGVATAFGAPRDHERREHHWRAARACTKPAIDPPPRLTALELPKCRDRRRGFTLTAARRIAAGIAAAHGAKVSWTDVGKSTVVLRPTSHSRFWATTDSSRRWLGR